MAAHGANAHADAIHGNGVGAAAENLVGFRMTLPLFLALAIAEILVDPGNETAGERHAEVLGGETAFAQNACHLAVDVENRRLGIVEQTLGRHVRLTHLHQQLAHVLRTGAGRGLVGHGRHPFDEVVVEQAA